MPVDGPCSVWQTLNDKLWFESVWVPQIFPVWSPSILILLNSMLMDIILTGHEKLRNVVDEIYLSESLCHVEQDWQLMIGCIPSSKTMVTAQLQQYRSLQNRFLME